MTLGSDVSGLTTTATSAAARGLSIVVPLYNEAARLAMLHERLIGLARSLHARYGLASEVVYVDDGSADSTLAIALTCAEALTFRWCRCRALGKGSRLDGRAGSCQARRRTDWTATASIRRAWSSWSRTGSMTVTTSSIRRGAPRQ
jgi:cellulose synthase/poly-beta-1,6-N-acetylglucosamine synthase-like glycosyltransferase